MNAKKVRLGRMSWMNCQVCGCAEASSSITGTATLKYRLEDEMISEYVAKQQNAGDARPIQEIAVEYNDTVIYSDRVRLNCYDDRVKVLISNLFLIRK